jgi:uncharacterized protein involved in exopolysaccharide biosynthesis
MIDERQNAGMQAGTVRDFLAILFKHQTKILVVFFVIVVTATVGTFFLPPTYEAKSSVMVRFGREYLYRPEIGDKSPAVPVAHQDEDVNSEVEIFTNRDLMKRVVTAIGAEKLYPDLIGKTYRNGVTPEDVAIVRCGKKLLSPLNRVTDLPR